MENIHVIFYSAVPVLGDPNGFWEIKQIICQLIMKIMWVLQTLLNIEFLDLIIRDKLVLVPLIWLDIANKGRTSSKVSIIPCFKVNTGVVSLTSETSRQRLSNTSINSLLDFRIETICQDDVIHIVAKGDNSRH